MKTASEIRDEQAKGLRWDSDRDAYLVIDRDAVVANGWTDDVDGVSFDGDAMYIDGDAYSEGVRSALDDAGLEPNESNYPPPGRVTTPARAEVGNATMNIHGALFTRSERGSWISSPLTFTDEHPSASYGLPVALRGIGTTAYGPADLPAGDIRLWNSTTPEELDAVRAAGFSAERTTDREITEQGLFWAQVRREYDRSEHDS